MQSWRHWSKRESQKRWRHSGHATRIGVTSKKIGLSVLKGAPPGTGRNIVGGVCQCAPTCVTGERRVTRKIHHAGNEIYFPLAGLQAARELRQFYRNETWR